MTVAGCDSGEAAAPAAPSAPSDPLALETQSESANGALPAFRIGIPEGIADAVKRESSSFASEVEWKTKDRKLPIVTVSAFPPPQATNPSLTLSLQTGSCPEAKGTIVSDSQVGARRKVVCQAKVNERGGVRKDETRVVVSWMTGKNFMLCRATQRGKADQAYLGSICDSLELTP